MYMFFYIGGYVEVSSYPLTWLPITVRGSRSLPWCSEGSPHKGNYPDRGM